MNWTTSDLADHYRRAGSPSPVEDACGDRPRRSKFNVDNSPEGKARRTVDGHLFASQREAEHYRILKISEEQGFIRDLVIQPRFVLQEPFVDAGGKKHRALCYVADFEFSRQTTGDLERVVVDVKGQRTAVYRNKLKLFLKRYPQLKFEEWK